jgi:hypothetical protein
VLVLRYELRAAAPRPLEENMARPRLRTRRSAFISIRTTRNEKEEIQKNAKKVNMKVTAFMINRSLHVRIIPKYDERMIDALNRSAGLVKHVAITYVGDEMRNRLWGAVKELRKTVAAIIAVVGRELELPKVIGSELKKLLHLAEEMQGELTACEDKENADLKALCGKLRAQIVRMTGCAQVIKNAYERELDKLEVASDADKVIDTLLDYVVIVAGLKEDIFALREHGATAQEIRRILGNRNIDLPVSAIELLLGTAQAVAEKC